jgi:predicted alpha/beta-hydrolase family hydrolase
VNCLPDNDSLLAQDYLVEGNLNSDTLIVLAHGAGANMHHDFMCQLAGLLVAQGYAVYRFNFLYMQANMQDGKRRPPDRAPKLLAHLETVLADIHLKQNQADIAAKRIVLVGKSMGSRMLAWFSSSLYQCDNADAKQALEQVLGVVCLGYPFVPLKGGEPRLEPLNESIIPTLILQGERDKFGNPQQISQWPLREGIKVVPIVDGDHSFVPRKSSGSTLSANLDSAVAEINHFISKLS